MAIYRAEDVSVDIDGTEILASSLSFSTSSPISEDRRLGAEIGGKDFLTNGPQSSSLSMNFYITGDATGDNPIFNLLKGGDAQANNLLTGVTGEEEIQSAKFRRRYDAENTGDWYEFLGEYNVYSIRYEPASGQYLLWKGNESLGSWDNGSSGLYGTGTWTTFSPAQTGTGSISRAGYAEAESGSKVYLGGQLFASGAALTSLSFSVQPFNPIICSASFDIYNEATGALGSGQGSVAIDPSNVAHGFYTYYSGITGINEVSSISFEINMERAPRYVVGLKDVHEIKTLKATKRLSFDGWGPWESTLKDPPTTFLLSLGSQNGAVYQDTISGATMDESLELPEAGLVSKKFTIIENLL